MSPLPPAGGGARGEGNSSLPHLAPPQLAIEWPHSSRTASFATTPPDSLSPAQRARPMTDPTITCPKCHAEIKLTESLAAPLLESTRQQ